MQLWHFGTLVTAELRARGFSETGPCMVADAEIDIAGNAQFEWKTSRFFFLLIICKSISLT